MIHIQITAKEVIIMTCKTCKGTGAVSNPAHYHARYKSQPIITYSFQAH